MSSRTHLRLRAALAALLAAAAALVSLGGGRSALAADAPAGPVVAACPADACTVKGSGAFKDLSVTVGQTKHLISQVVTIDIAGGAPTRPLVGSFGLNYLQVMQCWGEDAAGPSREQCQFGASTDSRGGNWTNRRQTTYDFVDRKETQYVSRDGALAFVPFKAVNGDTVRNGSGGQFYDSNTTNEQPFVRVRGDGKGQAFFTMQTAREAPGLGCGEGLKQPDATVKGRGCWLVVVPRNDVEVDGNKREETFDGVGLKSSPLSQSNWDNRMVVPLQFEPVGLPCPIGSVERRLVGDELLSEAVSRWQPTLCDFGRGTTYSYSQVADDTARRQLQTERPGAVFLGRPQDPALDDPTRPVVYAPVAINALAIAFNIERVTSSDLSDQQRARDGERVTDMTLNARLVAKLITQSYAGAAPGDDALKGNPSTLVADPEFKRFNPQFDELLLRGSLSVAIVGVGQADSIRTLFTWLLSDADAKSFLTGTPDRDGMIVNPNYTHLDYPLSAFAKADLSCQTLILNPKPQPLCTLDATPYAADFSSTAVAVSRGDTLSRNNYDPGANPPQFKKGPAQNTGQRALLGVTDVVSAVRFGLPVAKLVNAAGVAVAPTTASMLASAAAAKPGTSPSVLEVDPAAGGAQAYPLTSLTYAATPPSALSPQEGKEIAAFLRYAVGDGQVQGLQPGQLPLGYAPLPDGLRAQTRTAADRIQASAGVPVVLPDGAGTASGSAPTQPAARAPANAAQSRAATPAPRTPAATASRPTTGTTPATSGPVAPAVIAGPPTQPSGVAAGSTSTTTTTTTTTAPSSAAPTSPAAAAPTVALPAAPAAAAARTPATPAGAARMLLALVLVLGAVAAVSGPVLARRRADDA